MTKAKNPIDKDKVAENPHLLPYAHTLGSAIIKPLDKGKIKGLSMKAMYQQTEDSLQQIKQQIETLVYQAQEIHNRIDISQKIYDADCGFKPLISHTYYLYKKSQNGYILSMVANSEWGKKCPYDYIATVELLADHTWKIIEKSELFKEAIDKDTPQ